MANIVWDIDGVCTDLNRYILERAPQYFKKKYNKEVVNKDVVDVKDMFNCSKSEEERFWFHKLYCVHYSLFEKPREGLKEVMDAIHNNGDKNIICTARARGEQDNFTGWVVRNLVLTWIQMHRLPIDEVHFVSYEDSPLEKMLVCELVDADVIIEDDVRNIEYISKKFPVISYETEANKHLNGNNIIVAKDYVEVYSAIENLKNNKDFNLEDKNSFVKVIK